MSDKIEKPKFESLGRPLYKGERLTPFFFDESATFPELIYMLNDYINKLTERVNTYDEFANQVMALLEDIDKHIADITLEKLTEWYEDGTLQDMLQAVSTEFFENLSEELQAQYLEFKNDVEKQLEAWEELPRYSTLSCARIFRDIHECTSSKAVKDNKPHIAQTQGGVVFKRYNSNYYVGCNLCNVNSRESVNKVIINGYTNMYDITTRFKSAEPYDFGHCNGMTYDPVADKLYIAPSTRNSGAQYEKKIYRLDTSLNSYEYTNIPYHTTDIAYYDGDLYIIDDETNSTQFRVFKMEFVASDNAVLTPVCTFEKPVSQPLYNFDIADGKIFYADTTKHQIHVLELETGDYLWTYDIPKFDVTGCLRIKEIESITVFANGNIYLSTHSWDGLNGQTQCCRTELFVCNYKNNKISSGWNDPVYTERGGSGIYVTPHYESAGAYSTPLQCTVTNPNGSDTAPFETIAEAVQFIQDNPNISHCFIILTDHHRLYTAISTNKGIVLRSQGGQYSYPSTWKQCGGFLIETCPNFTMYYITTYNSFVEPDPEHPAHGGLAVIYAVYSNVVIAFCDLHRIATSMYVASELNLMAAHSNVLFQADGCRVHADENPKAREEFGGVITHAWGTDEGDHYGRTISLPLTPYNYS